MAFDEQDYQRGAAGLGAAPIHLMAVSAIESSGENFWMLGNKKVPPIRPEAHWFSRRTNPRGKYDTTYPKISRPSWTPSVAAKSRAEAWQQYELMSGLDPVAAIEATSWGPFQIMGFHWQAMGYPSAAAFMDAMDGPDDDGQMDTFVAFVKKDANLLRAIRRGDWQTWENIYNGGGYNGAYARKIEDWLATHGGKILTTSNVPRLLERGMPGQPAEDVKKLQALLGFTGEDVDGYFGLMTENAVKRFQHQAGLTVDGKVGRFTKEAMGANF